MNKKDTSMVNDSTDTCKYCSTNIYEENEPENRVKAIYIVGLSAIILATALYLNFFSSQQILAEILFVTVVIISGYETIPNGFRALFKGKFSISLLITIAAVGAFLIGQGAEGASVIFLFFIAEFLEDYAGERAKKSIGSLIKLTPQTATVKRDDQKLKLHAHAVDVDEIVVVMPGDKIPLDGIIINGMSSVNQSAITGESIPVTKKEGDIVYAGTINEEGYFELRVTKRSDETVLSKIIDLVKTSQNNKSKTEAFIDKFSNYYTPTVLLIAVIVATVPPFILGLNFDTWFYRALVLLVVSCPCALAISTPVSMVSGITAGTNKGVLIKGGEYVEEMQKIKTIVFDKTGTLTEGKLEVTDIIPLNNYTKDEILEIAGSLESKSKHPLADAVVKYSEKNSITFLDVKNFESVTGKGVKGQINKKMFYIGRKGLSTIYSKFPNDLIEKLEVTGKTVLIISNQEHVIGLIGLMDKIRTSSQNTIMGLKERNIKTIMLTGDNEGTANAVSSKIGIDIHYSGLLPEDKVKIINDLILKDEHVAMVGDGVNDAPALARSNVGIAMGSAGSDVAIETADIALMHDDISKISYIIDLSRKTMSVVKQNVSLSIIVKSSFAFFAILGFVSLWMAVAFGDMGLTLVVIINALRIGNN
ncbi:MAG: cation-translocating P-type ATPase [Methanobacterium sp.]|uniref:heavy metal translocating P-type ATPase n=2 Tax=Methanobacterium sp. TaxID=2164 RepID=UPI003C780F45